MIEVKLITRLLYIFSVPFSVANDIYHPLNQDNAADQHHKRE